MRLLRILYQTMTASRRTGVRKTSVTTRNTSAASQGAFSTNSSNESNSASPNSTRGSSRPRLRIVTPPSPIEISASMPRALAGASALGCGAGVSAVADSAATTIGSLAWAAAIGEGASARCPLATMPHARPATSAIPSTNRRDRSIRSSNRSTNVISAPWIVVCCWMSRRGHPDSPHAPGPRIRERCNNGDSRHVAGRSPHGCRNIACYYRRQFLPRDQALSSPMARSPERPGLRAHLADPDTRLLVKRTLAFLTALVVAQPFGPARGQPAAVSPAVEPPITVAAPASETVTLNFVNAEIDAVVRAVADITGRNFVVDPRVKGTVNIVSARPVPR